MLLRRQTALAASAVALAALLSSCGFDNATDRVYTPAAGPIEREASVDVLSTLIVSDSPGEGTFIAGLANNSGSEDVTFEGIAGIGTEVVEFAEVEPQTIPPLGFLDLSDQGEGIAVTGEFTAGDVLPIAVEFDTGEVVETEAVVVTACDEFAGFDTETPEADESVVFDCEPIEPAVEYGHGAEH